jgi:putative SOS response-associated peptidase YedK
VADLSPEPEPREDIRRPTRPGHPPTEDGTNEFWEPGGLPPARPKGPPVINFRSEGRRFPIGCCLVPASFFTVHGHEIAETKWRFTKVGEDWFASPAYGVLCRRAVRRLPCDDRPSLDVAPIHDRQTVV